MLDSQDKHALAQVGLLLVALVLLVVASAAALGVAVRVFSSLAGLP